MTLLLDLWVLFHRTSRRKVLPLKLLNLLKVLLAKTDKKLSPTARELIEDSNNDRLISLASIWEIAIKSSLGKLKLKEPFSKLIPAQLKLNLIELFPIQISHLSLVSSLPFYHRDPFDRLIIAQSLIENLPI